MQSRYTRRNENNVMANFNFPGSGGYTPGNGVQWCIVRARASALITDVPAFVNFHSSILSYIHLTARSPTVSVVNVVDASM